MATIDGSDVDDVIVDGADHDEGTDELQQFAAPEANDEAVAVANEADGLFTIDLNDYVDDPDLDDTLTFSAVSIGRGLVPFTRIGGLISFDPAVLGLDDGQSILTEITFTVSDQHGATDTGTVVLTINGAEDPVPGENEAPVAGELAIAADEADGPLTIDLSGHISDPDDDRLSVVALLVNDREIEFTQDGEQITIDPAIFGLNAGEQDVFVLTYIIDDGSGAANAQSEGTITLTLDGADDVVEPPENTPPTANNLVLDWNEEDGNLTIDLNGEVADADGDNLTITRVTAVGGFPVDFTFQDGVLVIDTASLGLSAGEIETFSFEYEVEDDSGQSNSSTIATIELTLTGFSEDDPPNPDDSQTLTFDENFFGAGGQVFPMFDNPFGAYIPLTNFEGLSFGGSANVIETDELGNSNLSNDFGQNFSGVVLGQTTPNGQNALLADALAVEVPVLDANGDPVVIPDTQQPVTETVFVPFGMYAEGFGLGLGDDPILLVDDASAPLSAAEQQALLDMRPDLTVDYDLESLSMNIAQGMGNITITTYRVEIVETADGNNFDYTAELVVADTFVFSSNASTPGQMIDFNDFLTNPQFETFAGSGISRLDDIYAVSFTTEDGTAVVLDDIMVLL